MRSCPQPVPAMARPYNGKPGVRGQRKMVFGKRVNKVMVVGPQSASKS